MSYLPTLLGLFTAFCWGTADFLSRSQSRRVGHYKTTVYTHITTFAMLVVIFLVLQQRPILPLNAGLILLSAGVVNFFAFIFLYRSFQHGVVAVIAPIAYTYPAVTTVLAVVLLGTVLAPSTSFALAGIMIGVLLLAFRFSELRKSTAGAGGSALTAGVGSAAVSAFSFGAVYVGVGYVTPMVGYVIPILILRGVGSLVGFVIAPALHQSVRPSRECFSRTVLAIGVLEAIGFLSFNYGISLRASSLPIVAALSGMGGAFAAGYAMLLLRERLERNQLLGIVLSIGGVFVLLYYGT